MIVCGDVIGSITTEWSGKSGRLLKPPFTKPLISVQVVPPSVVSNMCLVGNRFGSIEEKPG